MPDNPTLSKNNRRALIGAGIAAAGATAAFLLSRRTGSGGAPIEEVSEAPDHDNVDRTLVVQFGTS